MTIGIVNEVQTVTIYEHFTVNTDGVVFNQKTNRVLHGYLDKDGYRIVNIKGRHLKVHRLVALAFIPNPDNLPEVNHKDFDRANCKASNLEWVSRKDNIRYSRDSYAKTFVFLSPDGCRVEIHNLRKWCEDKPHLCRHSLAKLHRGVLKSYKG